MEVTDGIPISHINSKSVKWEMDRLVKFNIPDVNLTEPDNRHRPVVTRIGRKIYVNVTISGYITEPFHINVTNLNGKHSKNNIDRNVINIKDKVININFYGVRVLRDKEWDCTMNNFISVPKLMIDNTHEFYGFLKPIYVNNDVMDRYSEKNSYLSFQELKDYIKYTTVDLNTVDVGDIDTELNWIVEYKKKVVKMEINPTNITLCYKSVLYRLIFNVNTIYSYLTGKMGVKINER